MKEAFHMLRHQTIKHQMLLGFCHFSIISKGQTIQLCETQSLHKNANLDTGCRIDILNPLLHKIIMYIHDASWRVLIGSVV